MARGSPRTHFVRRAVYVLAVCGLAAAALLSVQRTDAQTQARSVGLQPHFESYDVAWGQFSVFVVLRGGPHLGSVGYDDDRDGIDDRFVESNGLGAFEFSLRYDPAVLNVVSVAESASVSASQRNFQCMQRSDSAGAAKFGCVSLGSGDGPQPVDSELTLATVTLLPVAPGSSGLELEGQLSGPLGDPIDAEITSSSIRLTGDRNETDPPAHNQPPTGAAPTPAQSSVSGDPNAVNDPVAPSDSNDPPPDGSGDSELTAAGTTSDETLSASGNEAGSQDGEAGPGESDSGAQGSAQAEDGSADDISKEDSADVQGAGGSRWTTVVWMLAALAGLAGAAAVGFAAVRWRGSR